MIKKVILVLFIINITMLRVYALNKDELSAVSAVVISEQTGDVLFEKNAHKKCSMASTTKIMTSLLAIESGKLLNEITVTPDMVKVEGTSMGLLPGDRVSLDELVHGMMLQSGNDAANVTAHYLSNDYVSFLDLMNERAREIGMNNTNFATPSGLDSDEHYSTAYDMALLGRESVSNQKFLSVCSKKKETLTYGNPPYKRTLYNHNRLLDRYDYALGIKTGFTKKSGRCLVSYARKDGVGLVAVTLNAPDDWNDHKKLLDFGFDNIHSVSIVPTLPDGILTVGGEADKFNLKTSNYVYSSSNPFDYECKVYIEKFIYLPVKNGDVVGYWDLYVNGDFIDKIPIIVSED